MVRLNKKIFREGIRTAVLEILSSNKGQYFTIKQIRDMIRESISWVTQLENILWLSFGNGLKGEIKYSINFWRRNNKEILSSISKGKGYVYVNPNDSRTPSYFDSKFLANVRFRKKTTDNERKRDIILFENCYRKCEDSRIRNEMVKIAIKHKIKRKRK